MRLFLVCLQTLVLGFVPTLGMSHAHSGPPALGDAAEVPAAHHVHGIGLEHGGAHDLGQPAPASEGETRNLGGDRLFMLTLKTDSAGAGLVTVRLPAWSQAQEDCSNAPLVRKARPLTARPPSLVERQIEARLLAPRRGPPAASV